MKTIVLMVISILLFISRIKSAPLLINKNKYMTLMEAKEREMIANQTNYSKYAIDGSIVIALFLSLLFAVYYVMIANMRISIYVTIFSILQIVLTVYPDIYVVRYLSTHNPKDLVPSRILYVFNGIVDYIYYPLVIWFLIQLL